MKFINFYVFISGVRCHIVLLPHNLLSVSFSSITQPLSTTAHVDKLYSWCSFDFSSYNIGCLVIWIPSTVYLWCFLIHMQIFRNNLHLFNVNTVANIKLTWSFNLLYCTFVLFCCLQVVTRRFVYTQRDVIFGDSIIVILELHKLSWCPIYMMSQSPCSRILIWWSFFAISVVTLRWI